MKVENLKRAEELREELRKINVRIETAEKATHVSLSGSGSFTVDSGLYEGMDHIIQSVKPLFLSCLNDQRQKLLSEVESLD